MSRTALIVNGSAGWGLTDPACVIQDRMDCEIVRAAAGTDITGIAAGAVARGVRRVIAAGGDGTLRAVAQALAGSPVEMAVLPAGTLNHFARDMEIPLDLSDAAQTAASGMPVCVDVAEV